MGMFDDVTVDPEFQLPQPEGRRDPVPRCFQTKDIACELEHYKINANGVMSPNPGDEPFYLYFYTTFATADGPYAGWIEYRSHVENGIVRPAKLVEYSETSRFPSPALPGPPHPSSAGSDTEPD